RPRRPRRRARLGDRPMSGPAARREHRSPPPEAGLRPPGDWKVFGRDYLPGLLGLEFQDVGRGRVRSRLVLRKERMAPNGYLHAATVVALADTSCGYGTVASLPEGAPGVTTIELKSNFLRTARQWPLT